MSAVPQSVGSVPAGSSAGRPVAVRSAPVGGSVVSGSFSAIEGVSAPDAVQSRQPGRDDGYGGARGYGDAPGMSGGGVPYRQSGEDAAGVPSGTFAALLAAQSLEATQVGPAAGPATLRGAAANATHVYDRTVQAVVGARPADLVGRSVDRAL